jgi:hypothetical protein
VERAAVTAGEQDEPRVVAVRERAAILAAARLALASLLLVVALLAGAQVGRALGAFALGGAFLTFAARVDRRALLLNRDRSPKPLPNAARTDP